MAVGSCNLSSFVGGSVCIMHAAWGGLLVALGLLVSVSTSQFHSFWRRPYYRTQLS